VAAKGVLRILEARAYWRRALGVAVNRCTYHVMHGCLSTPCQGYLRFVPCY
jgi:hypothetical protein